MVQYAFLLCVFYNFIATCEAHKQTIDSHTEYGSNDIQCRYSDGTSQVESLNFKGNLAVEHLIAMKIDQRYQYLYVFGVIFLMKSIVFLSSFFNLIRK